MTQRERDRLLVLNKADKETDHSEAGRPANRPQRTAAEAAAGEAPRRRQPGRDPCGQGRRFQPPDQRQGRKTSGRNSPNPSTPASDRRWRRSISQQRHGVHVGRETPRGWMAAAGLWKPRRRNAFRVGEGHEAASCIILPQALTRRPEQFLERGEKSGLSGESPRGEGTWARYTS